MAFACIICTEELCNNENNKPVNIKTCGHVFHENCLKTWLAKSNTCPICRNITLDSPNYVGKLHFQRLSIEPPRLIAQLLEENVEQKKRLEEAELELKRKEKEWIEKEREYKEKERSTQFFLKNINEDLKQMEELREKISDYTRALIKSQIIQKNCNVSVNRLNNGASSSSSSKLGASLTSNRSNVVVTRVTASTSSSSSSRSIASSSSSFRSIASSSGNPRSISSTINNKISVTRPISRVTIRSQAATSTTSTQVPKRNT